MLVKYHAVNPTAEAVVAEAKLNAYAVDRDQVDAYANGIYGNNTAIEISPGASPTFARSCYVEHDIEVVVIGSHFHRLGTRFEVWLLDDAGEASELVYENEDWESPELSFYTDAPISVPAGGGFEYRCSYENDTDRVVEYGDASTDEMCMFAAVYYPDQGFLPCRDAP